ncbi:FecR domain-containing protein [Butyrivibrio sp. LC3010]|uniref:FecR domain-containing protein n=1 Tax=Butyrivibrio sp. LC3010 TaxID=1280680 RepID=UPI00040BE1FD|nr:FecR domain-containing protein [Butyrivibrio sp. LC3010]
MRGENSYRLYQLVRSSGRFFACVLSLSLLFSSYSISAIASETKTDAASVMRLEKTEGTVSVSENTGKELVTTAKMRLNDGNIVSTKAKSYAYISLDATKAIKLDAKSSAEIKKTGSKYEALLNSGNLFFNVSEPLNDDEEFNIKTSTMTMGIRGTAAQVEVFDEKHAKVCLLEGSLKCTMSNTNGDSNGCTLIAGQKADFHIAEGKANSCIIETGNISIDDISGFTLLELYNNKDLANRVYMESNLDFRYLTLEEVNARLKKDQGLVDTTKSKSKKKRNLELSTKSIEANPEQAPTPAPQSDPNYKVFDISNWYNNDNNDSSYESEHHSNNSSGSSKNKPKKKKKSDKKKHKKKKNNPDKKDPKPIPDPNPDDDQHNDDPVIPSPNASKLNGSGSASDKNVD